METIVCLGLTHPELYCTSLAERCIMFTAVIVPPHYKVISVPHMFCHFLCLNGIYILMFLIMDLNCRTHMHIQAVTVSEYIEYIEFMLRFYLLYVQCSLIFEPFCLSKALQSTLSLMPNLWLRICKNAPTLPHILPSFLWFFFQSHSCQFCTVAKWSFHGVAFTENCYVEFLSSCHLKVELRLLIVDISVLKHCRSNYKVIWCIQEQIIFSVMCLYMQ